VVAGAITRMVIDKMEKENQKQTNIYSKWKVAEIKYLSDNQTKKREKKKEDIMVGVVMRDFVSEKLLYLINHILDWCGLF